MTTIRVRANVPESRQVTLTLPPEVPVGDAELEIVVREPAPAGSLPHFVVPFDPTRLECFSGQLRVAGNGNPE